MVRDPTRRFTERVAAYVRSRPSYPGGVLEILVRRRGLDRAHRVADVGSGTGKLAELFLRNGNPVLGVEPNRAMRAAAERLLAGYPGFRSVDGRAEATGLEERSVDVVSAGQAFHWFDVPRARSEFLRILHPGGFVVLVWNDRRVEAGPFMRAYEDLLREHGTDYEQVIRRRVDESRIRRFFAEGGFESERLGNRQEFDRDGLRERLLSSSYTPAPGQPGHAPMMRAFEDLFRRHARCGRVVFEYETKVYHGRLTPWRSEESG